MDGAPAAVEQLRLLPAGKRPSWSFLKELFQLFSIVTTISSDIAYTQFGNR
jgi:hypothetical protein